MLNKTILLEQVVIQLNNICLSNFIVNNTQCTIEYDALSNLHTIIIWRLQSHECGKCLNWFLSNLAQLSCTDMFEHMRVCVYMPTIYLSLDQIILEKEKIRKKIVRIFLRTTVRHETRTQNQFVCKFHRRT